RGGIVELGEAIAGVRARRTDNDREPAILEGGLDADQSSRYLLESVAVNPRRCRHDDIRCRLQESAGTVTRQQGYPLRRIEHRLRPGPNEFSKPAKHREILIRL